jgi:hypothetical protein
VTWGHGQPEIERLLNDRELERVVPDADAAVQFLSAAKRHLNSAQLLAESDPEAAYSTAYDGARKACASLLETQGLRSTTRGGHIAVRDAVLAQFGRLPGGDVFRSFDRLRRRRNDLEYVAAGEGVDSAELEEAIGRVTAIVEYADKVIGHLTVF